MCIRDRLEGGKKIASKDDTFYDKEVLKNLTPEWQKAWRLVSNTLHRMPVKTGDVFIEWRIRQLIEQGKIEVTGDVSKGWKDFDVKLPGTKQQETENVQLYLEFKKAKEIMMVAEEIKLLKEDTYRKNLNLFVQNIYPADNLFLAFNDALTATLNYQSAVINLQYQLSKININNSIR